MAKELTDPKHYLALAEDHLERVRDAWDPPDWVELGTYGLYCLEALIRAAVLKSGDQPERTHWGKTDQAAKLTEKYGLPDIAELHQDLNAMRKATAYGDTDFDEDDYNAEDICDKIEGYFEAVSAFVAK